MIQKTLREIAAYAGGTLHDEKYADLEIQGVCTDTRTIVEGNIFIPLSGIKYDGHNFFDKSVEKGARAALWAKDHPLPDLDFPLILVEDPLLALQQLAKNYRLSLPVKVVGITGSNGKTTTKDIIASVLGERYKVQKTLGNLNNHIGVPRTLLSLDEDTDVAVVEMGTESFGEISLLTELARPDIAIITNIGDAHLDQLHSRDNIARAKLEILEKLSPEGTFLYNLDDSTLRRVLPEYTVSQKIISFGTALSADYVLKEIRSNYLGNTFTINDEEFTVPLLGNHQIYNGAVAVIVGKLFHLTPEEIAAGMTKIDATGMRNELVCCHGFDILNDTYKSNPQSLISAFETLYMLSGYRRKIAIVGEMLGLGEKEEELHRRVGEAIDQSQVDFVLLIGDLTVALREGALKNFNPSRVLHFDAVDPLVEAAKDLIIKNTLVLVKASRSLELELVIEELKFVTVD